MVTAMIGSGAPKLTGYYMVHHFTHPVITAMTVLYSVIDSRSDVVNGTSNELDISIEEWTKDLADAFDGARLGVHGIMQSWTELDKAGHGNPDFPPMTDLHVDRGDDGSISFVRAPVAAPGGVAEAVAEAVEAEGGAVLAHTGQAAGE